MGRSKGKNEVIKGYDEKAYEKILGVIRRETREFVEVEFDYNSTHKGEKVFGALEEDENGEIFLNDGGGKRFQLFSFNEIGFKGERRYLFQKITILKKGKKRDEIKALFG